MSEFLKWEQFTGHKCRVLKCCIYLQENMKQDADIQ